MMFICSQECECDCGAEPGMPDDCSCSCECDLPPSGVVYGLYQGWRLVYIGQTRRKPEQRIHEHLASGKFFDDYSVLEVCKTKRQLDDAESEWIQRSRPIYNRDIPLTHRQRKLKRKLHQGPCPHACQCPVCAEYRTKRANVLKELLDYELLDTA